jgi:hypothetical protein
MSSPYRSFSSPFSIKLKPKQTSYNVYKVYFSFGPVRDHHALFVETDNDKAGYLIHVIGDVKDGMEYEILGQKKPHLTTTYLGQELIGTVSYGNIMRLMETCEAVPLPKKQLDELGRKIYLNEPFRRCGEWLEDVIQELKDVGILIVSTNGCLDPALR